MAPAATKTTTVSTFTNVTSVRRAIFSASSSSKSSSTKWVYFFGDGKADGDISQKALLGGKGAGLAEMSRLGLPVPPGFTITTRVCGYFSHHHGTYPSGLEDQVQASLQGLESLTGRKFGSTSSPLLLSIRSGAAISMPGMMDTVLNLGLNDETVHGLNPNNRRFAMDSYRRFIQMFGNVVLGINSEHFEHVLEDVKRERLHNEHAKDTELSAEDLDIVVEKYKAVVKRETGEDFAQDVKAQLWQAIGAVFKSWKNERAILYRKLQGIPEGGGTGVTVQAMVFGNQGDDCATGVAFTRDPATGENEFYGEFLVNAQGEDVVAGIRTPQPLTKARAEGTGLQSMEECMPDVFSQLGSIRTILEKHFRDVQDIEFTVEHKKLYMLQTRNGKRAARAAVKIAVDMVSEGLITKEEAVLRVSPNAIAQLLHRAIDPKVQKSVTAIAKGLPASPGAASGKIALTTEKVLEYGKKSILVRQETSADDVGGMASASGVLTARGGMTSHAAVVARGMGTPCVTGASAISIDSSAGVLRIDDLILKEGDVITIDGGVGEVYAGELPTVDPEMSDEFDTILQMADDVAKIAVVANAETPEDVSRARQFGAKGVGLARTEHMFFAADRVVAVREMILARDEISRSKALAKLLPMQRKDFVEILKIMRGFPVTVRFLDPPLHEFLPHSDEEMETVAKSIGENINTLRDRANRMREANPMLGLRGCRVGILNPMVYDMQAQAALEAAKEVAKSTPNVKTPVKLDLMVPFVATEKEISIVKQRIDNIAYNVLDSSDSVKYTVGTMIELPRAALRAGDIAHAAEFFSFGTNDLTQTAFGLSRDDAGAFLPAYEERDILPKDPFVGLDTEGVGELIEIAVERGRKSRPDLKTCLCGEQGADPDSVAFCHQVGLDSVSCSPFQVPVARLAAGHAAVKETQSEQ